MLEVKGSRHEERSDLLIQCIIRDVKKHLYFYIVAIFLVLISLQIIYQVQQTRIYVTQISKELEKQDKLNGEYQHLRLEQQTLNELTRVGDIARTELKMKIPKPEEEKAITINSYGIGPTMDVEP